VVAGVPACKRRLALSRVGSMPTGLRCLPPCHVVSAQATAPGTALVKWPCRRHRATPALRLALALMALAAWSKRDAMSEAFLAQRSSDAGMSSQYVATHATWRPLHGAPDALQVQSPPNRVARRAAPNMDILNDFAAMAQDMSKRKVAKGSPAPAPSPRPAPKPEPAPKPPAPVSGEAAKFDIGQEIDVEVIKISEHGATVQVTPQLTGFIHVSELGKDYIYHPGEEVREGEKLRARVRDIEPEFLQLTLRTVGRKRFQDFTIGQKVEGVVKRVLDFGAIVDIGADIDTMLHKTQIKEKVFVRDARDHLKEGDKVEALIANKDEIKKRISLSMLSKDVVMMPLQKLKLSDLEEGQELGGIVTSVRKFGCFVNVGAEEDGLLHVKRINDGIVPNIDDLMKHGDRLVVKVLKTAKTRNGKLELGLVSDLERLPPVDDFAEIAPDVWLNGVVSGTNTRGAFVFVEHPNGGKGVTAMLREIGMNPGQSVGPGDEIKVRVFRVNKLRRRVYVSAREGAAARAQ